MNGHRSIPITWLLTAGFACLLLTVASAAQATDRVVIAVSTLSGQPLGRLTLTDLPAGGVRIDPVVQGLPPGDHALVVASTASCWGTDEATDLFHPLTSGVYDDMDDQGRLQVHDRAAAEALISRQTAFVEQIAVDEARDPAMPAAAPRASRYSAKDTELALGNLPDLVVDDYGNATQVSFAPKITVAQLYGRSIQIRRLGGQPSPDLLGCAQINFPSRP